MELQTLLFDNELIIFSTNLFEIKVLQNHELIHLLVIYFNFFNASLEENVA